MRKTIVLLLFVLSILPQSFASHVVGGIIYWECLNNGKFVFYMEVYRDCTGIPFGYNNETIEIRGVTLPKDTVGNDITSFTIKPDSNRWLAENNGDISPSCETNFGPNLTCPNRDQGTFQRFYYKSDPIILSGVPPAANPPLPPLPPNPVLSNDGWEYSWASICCRPGDITNVNSTGSMLLRAYMYQSKDSLNTYPCFDSSPYFAEKPLAALCRKAPAWRFNLSAIDKENDSLHHSWNRPYNPANPPVAITYKTGYSPNNPTPDTSFHPQNIPISIDPTTGAINLAVFNGAGMGTQKYLTVAQVDAYKDGHKVATVIREIPLVVFNCLKLQNTNQNNIPEFVLDGNKTNQFEIEVNAGNKIELPIQIIDRDLTGGSTPQEITFRAQGNYFAPDFKKSNSCGNENCAYFERDTMSFDQNVYPNTYSIRKDSLINTTFVWQTSCALLGKNGKEERYNFYLNAKDDFCSVPGNSSAVITVVVKNRVARNLLAKCPELVSNGKVKFSWFKANVDSTNFRAWEVYRSKVNSNTFEKISLSLDYSENEFLDSNLIDGQYQYYVNVRLNNCRNVISYKSDTVKIGVVNQNIIQLPAPQMRGVSIDLQGKATYQWIPPLDSMLIFNYHQVEMIATQEGFPPTVFNSLNTKLSKYGYQKKNLVFFLHFPKGGGGNNVLRKLPNRDWYFRMATSSGCKDTVQSIPSLPARVMELETELIMDSISKKEDKVRLTWNRSMPYKVRIESSIQRSEQYYYIWRLDTLDETKLEDTSAWQFVGFTKDTSILINSSNCNDYSAYRIEERDTVIFPIWEKVGDNAKMDTIIYRTFSVIDTVYEPVPNSTIQQSGDTLYTNSVNAAYEWIDCKTQQKITGAVNSKFVPNDTGYYALIVRKRNCIDTTNCVPYFPVGLEKISLRESLTYFPNPTNGILNLQFNQVQMNVTLQVRNIHGQLVQEEFYTAAHELQLQLKQPAGLYVLQLINEKKEAAFVKVVKK